MAANGAVRHRPGAERVIQQGVDGIAFDIGVGVGPTSGSRAGQSHLQTEKRRPLPRWAIVVIALLIGWVLGALMNAQPPARDAGRDAGADEPVPSAAELAQPVPVTAPAALFKEGPVEAVYEQFSGLVRPEFVTDALMVVLVQAPVGGVVAPAEITVIEDGLVTHIELGRPIAGVDQPVNGQSERRMLVSEESVVLMALDSVMVFDPFRKTEPVEVAQAISLLPGSEPGRTWAVGSGSKNVFDIDVRSQIVRAEYDLTNVGVPLASYNGGLVVAPANPSLGEFALWSPARGIERLWSMNDQTRFIGAAGNVLVVHPPQGLASYNTVTGSLAQTDHEIPPSPRYHSTLSPDGSRLAIAARGSVTELSLVTVVDTTTGEQIDEFGAAFARQLQWISPHEVLFMWPETDAVSVMLRDTSTQTSSLVTELAGPNYWVTAAR